MLPSESAATIATMENEQHREDLENKQLKAAEEEKAKLMQKEKEVEEEAERLRQATIQQELK